ncbi:hypothetical protein TWF718_002569 [Orbilia javanica]|uniref:Uncharacterized protein n=1 Tax=Orbilia javanica TaxID=47235 RepID=A0AAN8MUE7_9PEZI
MCTDYEIWYACGHKGHPVRPDASKSNEHEIAAYADCGALSPTARVFKHCHQFEKSGKICSIQDRLVVTQRWEIVCFDNKDCKPAEKFDDTGCRLLQENLEASAIAGQNYLNSLTEKQRAELYKTSARISQPPVWGRKGPHVKKPRKVKTKEERERDKEEKERARAQKEAEKAEKRELAAARALTDLASGKSKGGRKKTIKDTNLQEPTEKKTGRKRKAEVIEVDDKPEPHMKKRKPLTATKVEPKTTAKAETKRSAQPKGRKKVNADTADQLPKPAPKRQRKEKAV